MNPRQEQILLRLAASQAAVSGDTLAGELGLSRTGIWKHIQALRKQNINIQALPGKGYQLIGDAMTAATLKARLNTAVLGRHIEILAEIDSTNAAAMRAAEEGAEEGMVVIATRQTAGRGRRGRLWHTHYHEDIKIVRFNTYRPVLFSMIVMCLFRGRCGIRYGFFFF